MTANLELNYIEQPPRDTAPKKRIFGLADSLTGFLLGNKKEVGANLEYPQRNTVIFTALEALRQFGFRFEASALSVQAVLEMSSGIQQLGAAASEIPQEYQAEVAQIVEQAQRDVQAGREPMMPAFAEKHPLILKFLLIFFTVLTLAACSAVEAPPLKGASPDAGVPVTEAGKAPTTEAPTKIAPTPTAKTEAKATAIKAPILKPTPVATNTPEAVAKAATTPEATATEMPTPENLTKAIVNDAYPIKTVNIRAGASITETVLKTVPPGTHLEVQQVNQDWARIVAIYDAAGKRTAVTTPEFVTVDPSLLKMNEEARSIPATPEAGLSGTGGGGVEEPTAPTPDAAPIAATEAPATTVAAPETVNKEVPQQVMDFLLNSVEKLGSNLKIENIQLAEGYSHTYTAEITSNGEVIVEVTVLDTPSGEYAMGIPTNILDGLLKAGYISQEEFAKYGNKKLLVLPGQQLAPEQAAAGMTFESTGLNPDKAKVEQDAIRNMAEKLRILGAVQLAIQNNKDTTGAEVLALANGVQKFNFLEIINPGIDEDSNIQLRTSETGWYKDSKLEGVEVIDPKNHLEVLNLSLSTDIAFGSFKNTGPNKIEGLPNVSIEAALQAMLPNIDLMASLYAIFASAQNSPQPSGNGNLNQIGINDLLPQKEWVLPAENPFFKFDQNNNATVNTDFIGHFNTRLMEVSGLKNELTPRDPEVQKKIVELYNAGKFQELQQYANYQLKDYLFTFNLK